MTSLRLVHRNGDTRELEVTEAKNNTLQVRWPLAGVYVYDLKDDVLLSGRKVLHGWHAESRAHAMIVYNALTRRPTKEEVTEASQWDQEAFRRMKG